MAKSAGKQFELNWANSYKNTPYYYMRLKDAPKWLRTETSVYMPENECDSIHHSMPFIWLLELKSTAGTGISFNPQDPYEKPKNKKTQVMIKANQVKSLMKSVEKDGVIAGFVLNYREKQLKTKTYGHDVYFVHVLDFVKFAKESNKSSISRDDCEKIGIKINTERLKVNYKYNIPDFIKKAEETYLKRGYIKKESLVNLSEKINKLINL